MDILKEVARLRQELPEEKDQKLAELAVKLKELSLKIDEAKHKPRVMNPLIVLIITSAFSILAVVVGKGFESRTQALQQTEQRKLIGEQQRAKLEADALSEVIRDTSELRIIQRMAFLIKTGIVSSPDRKKVLSELVAKASEAQKQVGPPPPVAFAAPKKEATGLNALSANLDEARKYEAAGFQALLDKNLDSAIVAFNKSEQSFNGYHMVYDIWYYLRKNRDQYDDNGDEAFKTLYRTLLKNYSYGMSPDVRKGLLARVGETG